MNIRELLGFERTFSTRNMYVVRIFKCVNNEQRSFRCIFRGPYVKNGVKYYEVFHNNKRISFSGHVEFEDLIKFRDLFPDLKRVSISQIDSIYKSFRQGDVLYDSQEKKTRSLCLK